MQKRIFPEQDNWSASIMLNWLLLLLPFFTILVSISRRKRRGQKITYAY